MHRTSVTCTYMPSCQNIMQNLLYDTKINCMIWTSTAEKTSLQLAWYKPHFWCAHHVFVHHAFAAGWELVLHLDHSLNVHLRNKNSRYHDFTHTISGLTEDTMRKNCLLCFQHIPKHISNMEFEEWHVLENMKAPSRQLYVSVSSILNDNLCT